MEIQTHADRTERGWADVDGFVGPVQPGTGPRRDPAGDFPTGPEIGAVLPDVAAPDQSGDLIDVHAHRGRRPAVVNFFRSAVW